MVPDLDGTVLTRRCEPATVAAIRARCGERPATAGAAALHDALVLLALLSDVPQANRSAIYNIQFHVVREMLS